MKERETLELNKYSNDLHEALINNSGKDFWRYKFSSHHNTAV